MEGIFYMNNDIGYCNAWPAPLKEAWKKHNKLLFRMRCLEGNLDRIDYADFDDLFSELETVQHQLIEARLELGQLLRRYAPATLK